MKVHLVVNCFLLMLLTEHNIAETLRCPETENNDVYFIEYSDRELTISAGSSVPFTCAAGGEVREAWLCFQPTTSQTYRLHWNADAQAGTARINDFPEGYHGRRVACAVIYDTGQSDRSYFIRIVIQGDEGTTTSGLATKSTSMPRTGSVYKSSRPPPKKKPKVTVNGTSTKDDNSTKSTQEEDSNSHWWIPIPVVVVVLLIIVILVLIAVVMFIFKKSMRNCCGTKNSPSSSSTSCPADEIADAETSEFPVPGVQDQQGNRVSQVVVNEMGREQKDLRLRSTKLERGADAGSHCEIQESSLQAAVVAQESGSVGIQPREKTSDSLTPNDEMVIVTGSSPPDEDFVMPDDLHESECACGYVLGRM